MAVLLVLTCSDKIDQMFLILKFFYYFFHKATLFLYYLNKEANHNEPSLSKGSLLWVTSAQTFIKSKLGQLNDWLADLMIDPAYHVFHIDEGDLIVRETFPQTYFGQIVFSILVSMLLNIFLHHWRSHQASLRSCH